MICWMRLVVTIWSQAIFYTLSVITQIEYSNIYRKKTSSSVGLSHIKCYLQEALLFEFSMPKWRFMLIFSIFYQRSIECGKYFITFVYFTNFQSDFIELRQLTVIWSSLNIDFSIDCLCIRMQLEVGSNFTALSLLSICVGSTIRWNLA